MAASQMVKGRREAMMAAGAMGAAAWTASRASTSRGDSPADMIVVATFNIRYANAGDGPDAWPHRKEDVARLLVDHRVDFAGLQEALLTQLHDLEKLAPGLARFGVGRDDGREKGEFSPLLYRRDRWRLIEGQTRWLSETPDKAGSKSWDAAITRIATRCVFEPLEGGRRLAVYNTHFDHLGATARRESAKLLRGWAAKETLPCIVMGDFNCTPGSDPYRELTTVEGDRSLVDARTASSTPPVGPDGTWNGFQAVQPGQRIDFIFTTREWDVRKHVTDDRRTAGGRFPSDHLPVIALLWLRKQ